MNITLELLIYEGVIKLVCDNFCDQRVNNQMKRLPCKVVDFFNLVATVRANHNYLLVESRAKFQRI